MKVGSGKRLAGAAALAGLASILAFLWAARAPLLERWYLWRLESGSKEAQAGALEGLGRCGADSSVPPLLGRLDAAGDHDPILATLREIYLRCRRASRDSILRKLLEKQDSSRVAGRYEFVELIKDDPEGLLIIFKWAGDKPAGSKDAIAGRAALSAWENAAGKVEDLLAELPVEELARFLRPAFFEGNVQFPASLRGTARSIARHFLAVHPDRKIRALAASFLANDGGKYDLGIIEKTFQTDRDLLVRTACLRILAVLGHWPSGPDISRVLFEEKDAALLREAIEARALLVAGGSTRPFDLWDGFPCDWLPDLLLPDLLEPLAGAEVERLEGILKETRDPGLRDAASLALAARWLERPKPKMDADALARLAADMKKKGLVRGDVDITPTITRAKSLAGPEPQKVSGFKVHEWGVWIDGGDHLEGPSGLFQDLPSFVHRSRVPAGEIERLRIRGGPSIGVNKPVLFFECREPPSIVVRVRFAQGRPWTFFPEATDYLLDVQSVSTGRVGATGGQPRAPGVAPTPPGVLNPVRRPAPSVDRPGIRPPWPLLDPSAAGKEELTRSGPLVLWIPPRPLWAGGLRQDLVGLGLEWVGLRVGYDPAAEAKPADVPEGSWWRLLRDARAAPIAIRGECERFLFYDGAVGMASPIEVALTGDPPDIVKVQVRKLDIQAPAFPAVFVIRKEAAGEAAGTCLEGLARGDEPRPVSLGALDLRGPALVERFRGVLAAGGLAAPEADSLVRIWEKEFFEKTGVRALTLLPREIYDTALPLSIRPIPEEVVRMGVVWKEIE